MEVPTKTIKGVRYNERIIDNNYQHFEVLYTNSHRGGDVIVHHSWISSKFSDVNVN